MIFLQTMKITITTEDGKEIKAKINKSDYDKLKYPNISEYGWVKKPKRWRAEEGEGMYCYVNDVLGILDKSIVFSALSMLMFIVTLAGQIYIQVPTDTIYSEPALFAVSLGFIFINVIWIILRYMENQFENSVP